MRVLCFGVCFFVNFSSYTVKLVLIQLGLDPIIGAYFRI